MLFELFFIVMILALISTVCNQFIQKKKRKTTNHLQQEKKYKKICHVCSVLIIILYSFFFIPLFFLLLNNNYKFFCISFDVLGQWRRPTKNWIICKKELFLLFIFLILMILYIIPIFIFAVMNLLHKSIPIHFNNFIFGWSVVPWIIKLLIFIYSCLSSV